MRCAQITQLCTPELMLAEAGGSVQSGGSASVLPELRPRLSVMLTIDGSLRPIPSGIDFGCCSTAGGIGSSGQEPGGPRGARRPFRAVEMPLVGRAELLASAGIQWPPVQRG
jgi:hypothetical protein